MKTSNLAKQEHISDQSINEPGLNNLEFRLQEAEKQKEILMSLNEDLRVSNEKLKMTNKELEKFFENIDEVLFSVDLIDYRLIQMSDACEKTYGYRASEFMADSSLWTKIIHPDDKHVIEGNDEELLKGNTVVNQYRIIHKNENIRWIEAKIIPTLDKNGFLLRKDGITKDITEKKLVEDSLLKSEANLHTLFDNTDAGYLLIDADLRLISFNEQAAKFAKQDLYQVLSEGVYIIDYFPAARKTRIKEMMDDALRGNNSNYELNYPRLDGSATWYNVRLFGVSNTMGEIFALAMSLTEITARKLAEEKLIGLNNILEERAAELAASNEELERFAYVASHDLQEPLRMVSSFLQLLQNKYNSELDANARKYINFAVDGAARMKILILDLLNFSRITTVKKNHTNVNLNDVISKTLHILQTTLNESEISVIVSDLPEVPGDESQLMQLFQNLTSNAIKYRAGTKPLIEIGYTEKDEAWEFFVRDNGIGIDAVNFDNIFLIFKRLHNRNDYPGTGIGLAICKKIVELHDGKIWVDSSKEKGSTFYFTIPRLKTTRLKHLAFNANSTLLP